MGGQHHVDSRSAIPPVEPGHVARLPFAMVYKWYLSLPLSPTTRAVLLELRRRLYPPENSIIASNAEIAKAAGVSPRSVLNALEALEYHRCVTRYYHMRSRVIVVWDSPTDSDANANATNRSVNDNCIATLAKSCEGSNCHPSTTCEGSKTSVIPFAPSKTRARRVRARNSNSEKRENRERTTGPAALGGVRPSARGGEAEERSLTDADAARLIADLDSGSTLPPGLAARIKALIKREQRESAGKPLPGKLDLAFPDQPTVQKNSAIPPGKDGIAESPRG